MNIIETIAASLFGMAFLLDTITTIAFLGTTNLSEGNPILLWVMKKLGWGWVVVKAAASLAAGWLCINHELPFVLIILAGVTGYVGLRNLVLIDRYFSKE